MNKLIRVIGCSKCGHAFQSQAKRVKCPFCSATYSLSAKIPPREYYKGYDQYIAREYVKKVNEMNRARFKRL